MSLVPQDKNPLALFDGDLVATLRYQSYRIYYYLRDVAPVVIKYSLIQLGRDGIDKLPFLSRNTKGDKAMANRFLRALNGFLRPSETVERNTRLQTEPPHTSGHSTVFESKESESSNVSTRRAENTPSEVSPIEVMSYLLLKSKNL